MAAALAVPAVADAGSKIGDQVASTAKRVWTEFGEDPILYLGHALVKIGLVLIGGGVGLSFLSAILRISATRARQDASEFVQQQTKLFANIQGLAPAPSWDWGNPLGSIEKAIGTAGDDLGRIGGDIGNAVQDLAHALWNTMTALPQLTWDTGVSVLNGTAGSMADFAYPYLLFFGLIVLTVGIVLSMFVHRLTARLQLAVNARNARFWNRFDARFGTRSKIQEVWTQKATEGMIYSANANPKFIPPTPGSREESEAIRGAAPPGAYGKPQPGQVTPKKGKMSKSQRGGASRRQFKKPVPPIVPGKAGPASTEEVQEELGEHRTRAPSPEELDKIAKESEANRVGSMPWIAGQEERLSGEARNAGRMAGKGIHMRGEAARVARMRDRNSRLRHSDGEEAKEAADRVEESFEEGVREGEEERQDHTSLRKTRYRGFMEGANPEQIENQPA